MGNLAPVAATAMKIASPAVGGPAGAALAFGSQFVGSMGQIQQAQAQARALQAQEAERAATMQRKQQYEELQTRKALKTELAARRARQAAGGVGGGGGSSAAVLFGLQNEVENQIAQSRGSYTETIGKIRDAGQRDLLDLQRSRQQQILSMGENIASTFL